jgi:hypothetical protein
MARVWDKRKQANDLFSAQMIVHTILQPSDICGATGSVLDAEA